METRDGDQQTRDGDLLSQTAQIVASHVANNPVPKDQVPALIKEVHKTLTALGSPPAASAKRPTPAVPINQSVQNDHIVCLEDGKKMKMLKRHLMTSYGMTPDQYRRRWGLAADYPMVAPAYAQTRSGLAKSNGLGRRRLFDVSVPKPSASLQAAVVQKIPGGVSARAGRSRRSAA